MHFSGIIADPSAFLPIPAAIGGRTVSDAMIGVLDLESAGANVNRCMTH